MTINDITTLISSVGFPIVCCGALFWYVSKRMTEFQNSITSSIDRLNNTILANTDATTKLVTTVELLVKIGGDSDG